MAANAKGKRLKTLHEFFMPKRTKQNSGDNDPDDPVPLAQCSHTVEESEKLTESNTVHKLLGDNDPDNPVPLAQCSHTVEESEKLTESNTVHELLGDNDPDNPVPLAQCSHTVEESEKLTESNTVHELLDPDDPANLLPVSQLERKNRIVRGPFQPILKLYPRTKFGDRLRCFNKSWYEIFNWLEYSVKLDRAFCFPCRMFTNSSRINAGYTDSAYSKVGFNNWKLATTKFKAHLTSKTHLNNITSLTNFLHLKPIDIVLDEERELIHSQKEQQRLKNRQIMQRLIDITLCRYWWTFIPRKK